MTDTLHTHNDAVSEQTAASIDSTNGTINATKGEQLTEKKTVDQMDIDLSWPAIKHYALTRVTELAPSKEQINAKRYMLNPMPGLRMIQRKQWLMILSAFLGWTWVAYDFFTISVNASVIAEEYHKSVKSITWGITLVLMLRTVGSIIFGYYGDRYGRKWPLVINLALACILEIGTGFVKNFKQFFAVRALFGILLGGTYGNAAATALDDCPNEARGIISGFMQQGYTFGYLLAVIFTRAIADNSPHKWKAMYWFGAGVMFLITIFRAMMPETQAFLRQQKEFRYNQEHGIHQESFISKAKIALRSYWLMLIYMVLLMAGFNFMSHGSQDLYPTLLTVRYSFSEDRSTVTNCVANLGALVGGILIAHLSNFIGRRLGIMLCCVVGGCLIYPWAFVDGSGINAGAFFLQFCVQGAWGIVPVHLSELAPPSFRSFVVGVSYQLGNLASAASATIETDLGSHFPTVSPSGAKIYDYAKVMAIFVGAVFAYLLVITFIGPERSYASFEMINSAKENEKEEVSDESDEEANIGLQTTVVPT